MLVSSHLLAELALSADRVVIIKAGRLLAAGSVDDITSRVTAGVRVRTPDVDRLLAGLAERGLTTRRVSDGEVVVDGAGTEEVGAAIATKGIVVYEMRAERHDLEEMFLTLTAGSNGGTS